MFMLMSIMSFPIPNRMSFIVIDAPLQNICVLMSLKHIFVMDIFQFKFVYDHIIMETA